MADAFKKMGGKTRTWLSIFSGIFGIVGPPQCGLVEGGRQGTNCLVNFPSSALGRTIMTALYLVGAATGAAAQDRTPVHYTCADGTKLQATFSPPSISIGSVKLAYAGSSTEMTLPQAVSADGRSVHSGRRRILDQRKGCNA